MHHIQEMRKPIQVEEPYGTRHVMAPIIIPKLKTAAKRAVTVFESCLLDRSKKRSPGVSKVKAVPEKEVILTCDKYDIGDFFSTDQFCMHTPVRLPSGYGFNRHQS